MQEIPYIAYESDMARLERFNRRLWIISIILLGLTIATNALWIVKVVM